MRRVKVTVTALLASAAFSFSAFEFPRAANAAINENYEWQAFEDVDVDRSGYVDEGEYYSYTYGMADWDNDGYLEETEWASYTETFYDDWDLDADSFTYYDTDGDGFIEETEFNEFAADYDLYETWDYNEDDLIDKDDWDQVTAFYTE